MLEVLLQQWSRKRAQKAVLCSVIEWKGSVPRKDYPMMLVLEDGSILGTIGGGSMELKVTKAATDLIGKSHSHLFNFDMTGTDVHADVGLCGGTLKVLVEPFSAKLQEFYNNMLKQMAENRKLMVQVSLNSTDEVTVNRRLITKRLDISETDPVLRNIVQQIYENQQTKAFEYAEHRYLIWQPFTPPVIHIFGAGHVGQSVATLAHFNDLQVRVYDDRSELMTSARFPHAKMIKIRFPIKWEDVPAIDVHDFVLIASREHKHDRELLSGLLKTPPKYIGLVSSSRKWKILGESLSSSGITDEAISKVHAPVGLNISAQTVPEIAISIMSEIIGVYRRILL